MQDDHLSMLAVLQYCQGLPVETFAAGDVLFSEGPGSNRMLILISGDVEVLRGDTQVAEVHEPGAVFGEISALLGGPHSATVKAMTPVSAYRVDDPAAFLREQTEVTFHVARLLARRLRDATHYLADFKNQFGHRSDHFAMVDEVLHAMVQRQRPDVSAGSTLKTDSRL